MKLKLLAASALIAVGAASGASATVLTFDSVADCATADVSISKGAAADACSLGGTPNGSSGLVATGQYDSYWTADFAFLQNSVSVDLGDYDQDADRLFLSAFDSSNNLLGTVTMDIAAAFTGMKTLSVAYANIARVTFGTTGELGRGGIYADNLTFGGGQVPLPAGGILLLSALGLGGAAARRRRKS